MISIRRFALFLAVLLMPLLAIFVLPMQAFALPGTNTVTAFTCTAPTTFTDGSALSSGDIQGYYLYWKTANGAYSDANKIQNTTCSWQASSLPSLVDGTYTAAATAYDANGESAFSVPIAFVVTGGIVTTTKKILSPPSALKTR